MRRDIFLGLLSFCFATTSAYAATAASCRDTGGRKFAERLVAQCKAVSPATHPPCHADNACDVIVGEIRRSCIFLNDGAEYVDADSEILNNAATAFCKEYLEVSGATAPSFDCAKAHTAIETAICKNNELAALDSAVAGRYQSALRADVTTSADQRAWLEHRNAACRGDADVECLRREMAARIDELGQLEQGLVGPAIALHYRDLIGRWRVRAVRVYGDGVQALEDDDAQYMGAVLEFGADEILWSESATKSLPFENCPSKPHIAALKDPGESSYSIPGAYRLHCGGSAWGPDAVIKSPRPKTLRLYWYDGAILTLKPAS